ncbi:MAG: ATP-binding protein [Gemmatimonadaceae bacterium]
MLDSVRARLALWHTTVLAVLLTLFALAAYVFLQRTTASRAEEYLASSAAAFVSDMAAEGQDATSDSLEIAASVAEFRVRDLGVAVFGTRGRLIALSDPAAVSDLSTLSAMSTLPKLVDGVSNSKRPTIFTLPDAEGGYRVSVSPARLGRRWYRVAMVQSRHGEQETLEDARLACLIAIPIVLIAAGLAGLFLARRSLAPVAAMSERAARISAANLHERLPVINPRDELGQLAAVINELLSRMDSAFDQQRRFMADASHELRTPVSIMRAEADVALGVEARSPAEYRESLGVVSDTAARLSTIVNELFLLARADAGQRPLQRTSLYLDELVDECVRAVRALALRADVTLSVSAEIEAPFTGDDELLRRLVINLLDNAIKYSGAGATVTLTLSQTADAYRISVRDTGPGIQPEAQPHLFERFFRSDVARSRTASVTGSLGGGAGLGLAIAQWIAESHGGSVTLARSTPEGTEFMVWLPREFAAPGIPGCSHHAKPEMR